MPPITSHVSLPSHTGATEAIIVSRAASSGANGKSMPTPRSKPSSSTYMNTLNARITVQIGTRSRAMSVLSRCRRQRARRPFVEPRLRQIGGQAAAHELREVIRAGAEDDRVDDAVHDERDEYVAAGQARRHRICRAQVPV